ncbi:phytoene desaturase family protein [Priestia koreensis]|uniref:phytoene desaturase family protein n=1 Tax=Priestia koreensis TaxID=284581 RepID=UPI001F5768B4|nr:phytoene desaturase family protein [Priestia koreensis]UNL83612.1 phytoene desaturase [Priestia koreensis]
MSKKVIVIGAGLGGLSTAVRLAVDGFDVTVLEKGERIGGKLNIRKGNGFTFDTGPSILTMPWVLEKLFDSAGRNINNYMTIERIEPQWRTFFEDGKVIDVSSDLPTMLDEIRGLSEKDANGFFDYLAYCSRMYEYSMKSFYSKSISGLNDLRTMHSLKELLTMDPTKSMDMATRKFFESKHLRQLFNFLVMYVGSSPYHAPAILSQLAHVQLGLGIYYVDGGMYKIAEGIGQLLDELGVEVRLNTPVKEILATEKKATGVVLESGDVLHADIIVSNLEAIPAHKTLLNKIVGAHKTVNEMEKFIPSVSGLVMLLGVNRTYDHLAHHNFFFSRDPEREFHQIFNEGKPADDPTIYIGISAKSDGTHSPVGKENLFVLTHVPPLKEGQDWSQFTEGYRELVLAKLERMGVTNLSSSIEFEHQFTPNTLKDLYGANGGSIYGVAADRKKNGGFRIANRSKLLSNLYFVGGSTHPGGGVPMVTLSGQLTADAIVEDTGIKRTVKKNIG